MVANPNCLARLIDDAPLDEFPTLWMAHRHVDELLVGVLDSCAGAGTKKV